MYVVCVCVCVGGGVISHMDLVKQKFRWVYAEIFATFTLFVILSSEDIRFFSFAL
jgi:hypothetical protein